MGDEDARNRTSPTGNTAPGRDSPKSHGASPEMRRQAHPTGATPDEACGLGGETNLSMSTESLLDFSRSVLSQDPSSQLFVPLAQEFCARQLWKEAVETCRRGLIYHPHHFRGRVLLGWALFELGEEQEAEALLTEACKELERNAVIYRILAELAQKRGDSDQAWRLMHIYHSLQDGHLHHKQESEPGQVREAQASQPIQPEEPPLIALLSSLLTEYERERSSPFPDPHLFSDTDRKVLKEIIISGTS
ncbi:tetratricopeptide repeat protein [Desulfoferrobacter suflitae]|uniref:tetratricopeptide repeat protein n=1 Tax=Desulfoferrobacter suflitae TaxID=2865782 RepID=UPI0021644853|nr:hypothetical protein [Desulfoferrobacter suflitae]MCK8603039.1 hypothetical protein [Desulfoferrobacter suflitae]